MASTAHTVPPAVSGSNNIIWQAVIAAFGVLFALLLGLGAFELRFNASYRAYFDADDPMLVAYDQLESRFDSSDALLLLVAAGPGESVFSPAGLALIRDLTAEAAALPGASHVESLTNSPYIESDPDGFRIRELLAPARRPGGAIDLATAQQVRRLVRGDRLIEGALVDRSGRVALIAVTLEAASSPAPEHSAAGAALGAEQSPTLLEGGADALSSWSPVMHAADVLLRSHATPGFDLHASGIVAMNYAFAEATLSDALTLIPLGFLLLFVFVAIALRSVGAALLVLTLSLLTQVAALGLLGWSGVPLSSTVAMAPLMLLTITVADGVHVLLTLRALQRERPASEPASATIAAVFRSQRAPVFLATATTVIGFLTMNFSAVPTYQVLGNVVAAGAVVAGLLTLVWMPAVLRLWSPDWTTNVVSAQRAPPANLDVSRMLGGMLSWLTLPAVNERTLGARGRERRRLVVAATLFAVLLTACFGWSRLRIDDAFVHYFSPALAFRQAADVQSSSLGGLYEIEYAVDSGQPGGVHQPQYLQAVDDFVRYLEAQPETRHVTAWTRVLQRIHERMRESNGLPALPDALPETAALAAQYLLLYQLSLPLGHDATAFVDVNQSGSRVRVSFGDLSSAQMLALEARIDRWFRHAHPEVRAEVRPSGQTYSTTSSAALQPAAAGAIHASISEVHSAVNLIFSHLGGRNVAAMMWANLLGVVAIAGLIALMLRNLGSGLLSAAMNLIPLGLAFAVWGLTVRDVGLSLSVAAGMTLGILDHNAVHLLSAYYRHRRRLIAHEPANAHEPSDTHEPVDVGAALRATLIEVGPGILVTNLSLMVGFFMLALSSFQLNAQLGSFTVLTLGLALLVNLVFLPAAVLFRSLHRPHAAGILAVPHKYSN